MGLSGGCALVEPMSDTFKCHICGRDETKVEPIHRFVRNGNDQCLHCGIEDTESGLTLGQIFARDQNSKKTVFGPNR